MENGHPLYPTCDPVSEGLSSGKFHVREPPGEVRIELLHAHSYEWKFSARIPSYFSLSFL